MKLIAFFVGQVMKRSRGKADPKGVQPVLVERLNGSKREVTLNSERGLRARSPRLPFTVHCLPSLTRLIGSTVMLPYRAIQCRCGPVTRPLWPTRPMIWPRVTVSPVRHQRPAQVEVPGDQSLAVVHVHHRPRQIEVPHQRHDARVGRAHRCADRAREVGAEVSALHFAVEHARACRTGSSPARRAVG